MHDRGDVARQICRISVCGKIAFTFRALETPAERRLACVSTRGQFFPNRIGGIAASERTLDHETALRRTRICQQGAVVVVNYLSSKEGADRVVDEITKRSGKAIAVQANVAKKADVERLFAGVTKAFGKIDILVNNAGVYEFAPRDEITQQQFHKHFDVNVLGLLFATQEGVPAVIPAEACYLGWQESLTLLAKLVEAEIPD
jgi:hypothetical protein